ncbi:MAG: TAXI family TRAP transporter solute-binding subunit [Rhodospirillaceae bacterium]
MKFRTLAFSAVLAAIAALPAAAQQTYSIGTNPQGSLFFGVGTAIAKVLNEKANMLARVQAGGGTSTIAPQLDAGRVDFSFNNAIEARYVYTGTGTFEGKPLKNLRLVHMVYPLPVTLAVPNESKIKSIAEAKGLRLPSEFTAQNIMQVVQNAILANHGLKQSDFSSVPVSDYIKGQHLLPQGRVDIAMAAPGTAASREDHAELKSKGGLRFLPINTDEASLKRMHAVFPETLALPMKESPARPGIIGDTTVMAYPFFLVAGAHVSEEAVYNAVKALHAGKKELVEAFAPLNAFEPKEMWRSHSVPYHPGALKAFKELGLTEMGKTS